MQSVENPRRFQTHPLSYRSTVSPEFPHAWKASTDSVHEEKTTLLAVLEMAKSPWLQEVGLAISLSDFNTRYPNNGLVSRGNRRDHGHIQPTDPNNHFKDPVLLRVWEEGGGQLGDTSSKFLTSVSAVLVRVASIDRLPAQEL